MLEYHPLASKIGVEVRGVDLSRPLSDAQATQIKAKWLESALLLFRGQRLTPEQQVAMTRQLGEPMVYTRSENALKSYPEVLVLSNVIENGKPVGQAVSGRYWHTDGHFLDRPPAASILFGVEVPDSGGDTLFANTAAAYDMLPAATKERLEGLKVIISRVRSVPYNYPGRPVTEEQRKAWPDKSQPLVRTHGETGRKAIYAGGNVPWCIEGMPEEESNVLVRELQEFCIRPEFVYVHKWRAGDLLIWDNRSAIHSGTDYDQNQRRRMHRTTTIGEVPV
jgi:putative 2-oxoglutarate oxygenase